MPHDVKSKSKGSIRKGRSGGGRRKQPSSTGKGPSSVSGRLCSSSPNGSDGDGDGEVPVESVSRRLHGPDYPVAASALLDTISETGAPSASSLSIDNTSIEGSPPHPSHPAEGIGGLPTSSTAGANVSKSPEAVCEGVPGDRSLSWDLTVDGTTGVRLPPPVGTGGGVPALSVPIRPEIEQLGALGRLAQQREQERVVLAELDRVAREQRKSVEDA